MDLYIIFIQRKERYEGQYGVEAVEIADEYTYADNPDWLNHKLEVWQEAEDIIKAEIVTVKINETEVKEILFPSKILKGDIKKEK